MLDLVFFGVLKQVKRRLPRDATLPVVQDHARRMFRAVESVAASSTIRGSFQRAGFAYVKTSNGTYTLEFNENKARESSEFLEVWTIDFPLGRLSARR
jgi:hypothetical protein